MIRILLAILLGAISSTAIAQQTATVKPARGTAVINWNAKPRPFSSEDYAKLLSCTLSRHPDETRRYAEYHLQWRHLQSPEQNERDPNSSLFMPALAGCFEIADGEPFPFSLDKLIGDWGRAYVLIVVDTASLAKCTARNNDLLARAFVMAAQDPTIKPSHVKGLMGSLSVPPCAPVSPFSLNQTELLSLLIKELKERSAAK